MLVVCLFSTLVFCQKVLFVLYKLTKRVMIWSLMRFYYPFLQKKYSLGFVQIRKRGTKSHSRVHLVPTFKKKHLFLSVTDISVFPKGVIIRGYKPV